jgi:hypothetical protein
MGRVTSYCQVAEVAPTTSGVPRKVLKLDETDPSSCRYWLLEVSTLPLGPLMLVVGV